MKKVKVLGISFLAISLCVPLLGFKYVATETSIEANSLLNSSEFQTSSSLDAFESTEISSSSTVVGNETSGSSTTSTSDQGNTITTESNEDQNTVRLVPTDEKFYISITDKNYELLDKPDGTIIEDKKQQYQKTFSAQTVIGESGTEYYELSNLADHVVGYIRPISAEVVEGNQGKFYSENNVYASIDSSNVDLLNEQFQKQGTTEKIMNQTFKIDGYYNHFDGTTYYLLSDMNNQKIGLVTSIALKISENPFGKTNIVNDYYTVIKDDQKIWTNLEFTEVGTTEKIMNQTFNVKEWYYHLDGKKYYALYDNSANFKGFVEENTIKKAVNPGGIWHSADYYVSITKNNWTIWKDFNFKNGNSTKDLYQRTYKVTGYYKHFNGAEYLSIYDNNGDWLGYLNAEGAQVVNDPGGKWNSTNQYVTITKNNWTIWKDFNFKSGSSTKNLYQRTYRATGWYRHYNGSKYLSIYDNSGKWLGYLNAEGVQVVNNPGGKWNSTNQYVTITKNNWTIWKDFNFKSGSSTKNLYQRTYRATGWYRHYNGSKYLSIYDNNGKWLGYLNAEGAQVTNNPGGKWNSTSQYATVNKSNWTIWKDFNFKNGTSTKNLNTKTYKVTGWYRHYNGSKYLSIYDNNGKWQGYLNADGATTVSGAQGTGFSTNKSVLVIKNGYSIWNNFNWNEKTRTNSLINKTYQVKWYYKHMNGSTYYSLYEANGKWFGYVNSDAVRERKGAASYLGTTRQRVVNELSTHQNDRFYFGTPYRGLSSSNPEPFLSPYGAPNAYGPGMNCTGFVACVMRRSGGNLNRISGITQGWGSYANAYNWRDALMRNTEYYTFNSVDALLKSGKAQKGDIIYFDPVWTDINYDCHIGIFWGNSSTENKIWHQVLAGNMTSNIFSGTRFSKIYLFPQD